MKISRRTKHFFVGILVSVSILILGLEMYILNQIHTISTTHRPAFEGSPEGYGFTDGDYDPIQIVTADGLVLEGTYFHIDDPRCGIVLFHGSADFSGQYFMLPYLQMVTEQIGCNALIFSQRNYAGSEGTRTTFGVEERLDGLAAFEWLSSHPDMYELPIGFLGLSAGSSTLLTTMGAYGVGDFAVAAVPFADFGSSAAWRNTRSVPALKPLLEMFTDFASLLEFGSDYLQFQPDEVIDNIEVPVLLITSTNDEWVDNQDVYNLAETGGENFQVWTSQIESHDLHRDDRENFERVVVDFVDNYLSTD